jgi:predicted GNAT superfamily acetyltransferase
MNRAWFYETLSVYQPSRLDGPGGMRLAYTVRKVKTIEDCELVHDLAAAVWGESSACSVPQLYIHATKGGVVLLAENEQKEPIGFLFSFPALYQGEWVLWSHETAVLDEYLHKGIGAELKRVQRQMAQDIGYSKIAWTFDPLVSRNAYFNLVKLGATITEYQQNVYGVDKSDLINRGIETDRFIAVWSTAVEPEEQTAGTVESIPGRGVIGDDVVNRPVGVNLLDGLTIDALTIETNGDPQVHEILAHPGQAFVRTYIPTNFGDLVERAPERAHAWRLAFRRAAFALFAQRYRPTAFRFDKDSGTAYYLWTEVQS